MRPVLYDHRDTLAPSKNKHLELFTKFFHLFHLITSHLSVCLFFADEETRIHCIDNKWLRTCDYLDSSSWLEGFSSATMLPIHQLIACHKSQPFTLMSTPHTKWRSYVYAVEIMPSAITCFSLTIPSLTAGSAQEQMSDLLQHRKYIILQSTTDIDIYPLYSL